MIESEMPKIKIIGLGGIGSVLCEVLCRYLNYSKGAVITLIDGDSYEVKNHERQIFVQLGNKANVKCNEMRSRFDYLSLNEFTEFVSERNVSMCVQENDVVFLCVDNHKTRKIVSEYADTLNNVVLISAGNDWEDGNVQLYIREDGKKITPSLTDYHPEIMKPDDRLPGEMSCEELSKSEPQLFFTNLSAAAIMCWVYYNLVVEGSKEFSEIYFDIAKMAVHAVSRKLKQ